jgi:DNA invertase Pin-like site-specific DNA recombinase
MPRSALMAVLFALALLCIALPSAAAQDRDGSQLRQLWEEFPLDSEQAPPPPQEGEQSPSAQAEEGAGTQQPPALGQGERVAQQSREDGLPLWLLPVLGLAAFVGGVFAARAVLGLMKRRREAGRRRAARVEPERAPGGVPAAETTVTQGPPVVGPAAAAATIGAQSHAASTGSKARAPKSGAEAAAPTRAQQPSPKPAARTPEPRRTPERPAPVVPTPPPAEPAETIRAERPAASVVEPTPTKEPPLKPQAPKEPGQPPREAAEPKADEPTRAEPPVGPITPAESEPPKPKAPKPEPRKPVAPKPVEAERRLPVEAEQRAAEEIEAPMPLKVEPPEPKVDEPTRAEPAVGPITPAESEPPKPKAPKPVERERPSPVEAKQPSPEKTEPPVSKEPEPGELPDDVIPFPAVRPARPGRRAPRAPAQRALGYVSVADVNGQAEDLEAQTEEIRAASVHNGFESVEVVRDFESHSGSDLERPGLIYALEKLEAGEASCLVVTSLERLTRSAAHLGTLIDRLGQSGIRLLVLDIQLDTGNPDGRLAAEALANVGTLERKNLDVRTRKGLQAAREGRRSGRPAVADRPALKERIAGMRARGMTLQAIADTLNAEGVPTLRGGSEWRPSSVQAAVGYKRPKRGAKKTGSGGTDSNSDGEGNGGPGGSLPSERS